MDNQNGKFVYNKENFTWHYVSLYLDSLTQYSPAVQDEEFMRYYQPLRDYVDSKIFTLSYGEIVELSVLVKKKI